jgi:hypothetical protein
MAMMASSSVVPPPPPPPAQQVEDALPKQDEEPDLEPDLSSMTIITPPPDLKRKTLRSAIIAHPTRLDPTRQLN